MGYTRYTRVYPIEDYGVTITSLPDNKFRRADVMQAIAARNRLKSVAKQREEQQQQLRALIIERRAELQRSSVHYVLLKTNYYCKMQDCHFASLTFLDQYNFYTLVATRNIATTFH